MTKRKLSNPFFIIKSFFVSSKKKTYLTSLEKAYCEQALELQAFKRSVHQRSFI